MRDHRDRRWAWAAALVAAVTTIGAALAQDPEGRPAPAAKGKAGKAKKAGLRAGGGAPPKEAAKKKADPLAADVGPVWPIHWRLRIAGSGGTPLAAYYYPSKLQANAPVVLLIHETGPGRSAKDFRTPIDDLKGQNFAEYLQENEYAVLALDLRGHGANGRKAPTREDWPQMVEDIQAAYLFLVDRHNHHELNLAKLGVVALGDGATLAAAWAAGGGGVSSEGRITDLRGMALISPAASVPGVAPLSRSLAAIAPRLPLLLVSGNKNNEPVRAAKDLVERQRQSKVLQFDTPLGGQKLLGFIAGVPQAVAKFFEDPVKFHSIEWDGRYLLTPTAFSDVEIILPPGAEPPAAAPKAKGQRTPAAKKGAAAKGPD